MAYPLSWTGGPAPSSESWILENADISGGVSLSGNEKIVSSGTSRWRAKLVFQLFREETLWVRAFAMRMRGRAGRVLLGPFDLYGMPQSAGAGEDFLIQVGLLGPVQSDDPPYAGAPNGTLAGAAVMRATNIVIRMLPGRALLPGTYLGIGQRLHVVTTVLPLSEGVYACGIEPGLRADAPPETPVIFDHPVCVMRSATAIDSLTISAATFTTDLTLDLVEVF